MATHHRGNEAEKLALDTYIKLVRAVNTLSQDMRRNIEDQGLTAGQFAVLEALYHLGPLCQRALGSKLLLSGGNIVKIIDNLERDGLVKRQPDPADRRSKIVHLTPAGSARLEAVFPSHVALIMERFAVLTPEEQRTLGTLAKTLGTTRKEEP